MTFKEKTFEEKTMEEREIDRDRITKDTIRSAEAFVKNLNKNVLASPRVRVSSKK